MAPSKSPQETLLQPCQGVGGISASKASENRSASQGTAKWVDDAIEASKRMSEDEPLRQSVAHRLA